MHGYRKCQKTFKSWYVCRQFDLSSKEVEQLTQKIEVTALRTFKDIISLAQQQILRSKGGLY